MIGATSPLPPLVPQKKAPWFTLEASILSSRPLRASESEPLARSSREARVAYTGRAHGVGLVRKMNDSQMDTSICVPLAVTFWIYCMMPRKSPWFLITWPHLPPPYPPPARPSTLPLSFISLTSYLFSRLSSPINFY